jgi:metal-sulfur cluster biosynthetic enzyme
MPPSERKEEGRTALAWRALEPVTDPELDESVVGLGFIARLEVTGGRVAADFRLPTFWCAANFAAIMAEDIRDALAGLDWVEAVEVRLVEHFAEAEINRMIAERRGFAEAFGAEAGGGLSELRHTFRRKAYLGRMSALIEALRAEGRSDAAVAGLRIGDLRGLAPASPLAPLAARFLQLRGGFGGPAGEADPAFRLAEGEPVTAASLPEALRAIRMTRRSAAANGEMCKALLAARYGATGGGPGGNAGEPAGDIAPRAEPRPAPARGHG